MFHGNLDYYTALGLKELKARILKENIPSSQLDKSINVATWNIREFGKSKRRKESLHYIAEILGQFDLIAVTEVRKNISQLKQILDILGPYWKVVFSDYTLDRGGNGERMAYLYDKRAVVFTGLAAEADPPRKKNKKTGEYEALLTWWRPPFIASFSAGNFDFILMSVHIRWGNKISERRDALKRLALWVDKKRKDAYSVDKDIIIMGDFNIPKIDDPLFQAITSKGLRIPESIRGLEYGSNLAKNKRYDQIFYYPKHTKSFTNNGGILDFHTGGIEKLYPKNTPDSRSYTYEMSDHLPLWVQLNINLEDEKLEQILQKKRPKQIG